MLQLVLLALLALPSLDRADDKLDAIEIHGNTRTAQDVVIGALGVQPGDPIDDDLLPELRQRVLNTRLFREVEVTKRSSESGQVLSVDVKERWTLIPVPILGASGGAAQVGLALFETNLFGRRKLLAATAVYSTRGQAGMLFYRDPALFDSRALLAVELVAENKIRERADGFDVVQAYRDRRIDASVRPGFRLAPRLEVRAGPFVSFRESQAAEGYAAPPPAGNDFGIVAELAYEGQDYRDWFNAGPAVHAIVRRSLPALGSDRSVLQSTAQATWSVSVAGNHVASATVAGYLVDGDPVLDAIALGGRPGSRGLRAEGLWTERAVTATVDDQLPVWRPSWGTLTVLGFVDAGVSTWSGERTSWVAPGGGVRLYLRNIALPALGFDLAYSTAGKTLAPSFFLGFQ